MPLARVPVAQTLGRGATVTLQCTAMGGPGNTFQWLLNNVALSGETSPTLTRLNIAAADGGVYTCMVSNTAGTSSASTSVFIFPYFTSQPQDMGGAAGSLVSLMCTAEAFPAPTYRWSRASGGGQIRTAVTGRNSSTLQFSSLQFGDEGNYICTATSGTAIQSQPATLTGNDHSCFPVTLSITQILFVQLLH